MAKKKLCKPLGMAVVVFFVAAGALAAQPSNPDHKIAGVEYLGNFEEWGPMNNAMNAQVAQWQKQTPSLTYTRLVFGDSMLPSHSDLLAILRGWEATIEADGGPLIRYGLST